LAWSESQEPFGAICHVNTVMSTIIVISVKEVVFYSASVCLLATSRRTVTDRHGRPQAWAGGAFAPSENVV